MTTGQLRRSLRQIRETLDQARRVIDIVGGATPPSALARSPRWGDRRAPEGHDPLAQNKYAGEANPLPDPEGTTNPGTAYPLQDAASSLAEAHSLLFAWTTALWGRPTLLVDEEEQANPSQLLPPRSQMKAQHSTSRTGGNAELPESQQTAMAFWAAEPQLARQSSHRRRRLHVLFLDTPEDNDTGN